MMDNSVKKKKKRQKTSKYSREHNKELKVIENSIRSNNIRMQESHSSNIKQIEMWYDFKQLLEYKK